MIRPIIAVSLTWILSISSYFLFGFGVLFVLSTGFSIIVTVWFVIHVLPYLKDAKERDEILKEKKKNPTLPKPTNGKECDV